MNQRNIMRRLWNAFANKVRRASRLSTGRKATECKVGRASRLSGQPGRLSYILAALVAVVTKVGRASRLSGQPGRLSYILSALAAVVTKVGRASRLSTGREATETKASRPPRRIRDLSGQPGRLSYISAAIAAAATLAGLWAASHLAPTAFANSGGSVTYYTLTLCTPDNGDIIADPIGPSYVSGTTVTVTAVPDAGYQFSHWTGSISGSVNPTTIAMNSSKSICAEFMPVVRLAGGGGVVREGEGSTIWITLSAPSSSTVTVDCYVTGGDASAADFSIPEGAVTFAPGSTNAALSFEAHTDAEDEGLEWVELTLSNPVNALLAPYSYMSVAIGELNYNYVRFASETSEVDESIGRITIPLEWYTMGHSGGVAYTVGGTATTGDDYIKWGNIVWVNSTAQANEAAIELEIVDDAIDEGDETIVITLQQIGSAVIMEPYIHTVTITDNDEGSVAAAFDADPISGVAPLEVTFTDASAVSGTTVTGWSWDFGDGNTSTDQHPVHTYEEEGIYTVSFTVETASGNDTVTREDLIEVGGIGAAIGVTPTLLQFGYVPVDGTGYATLRIANTGDQLLTGTAVVDEPFGFEGDPTYAVAPQAETYLTVRYAPLAAGTHYDVIGLPGGGNELISVYGSSITPQIGVTSGIRLNELAIWNTSGLVSGNGDHVDWIELYNENNFAVDLDGWSLTDDDTNPTKYVIPPGTVIGPESYLILFASTDAAPPAGELHTGFELDEANGGYLGLFAPSAGTANAEVDYPVPTDESRTYGLLEDESKAVLDWIPCVPTLSMGNYAKKVWPFTVYASSHIVTNDIPDPTVPYNMHTTGDQSNFIPLSDWLNIVKSETSRILGDQSGQTIVSPMNSSNSVIIGTSGDLSVSAEVQLNLGPIIFPLPVPPPTIPNMPNNLGMLQHLFKTMHNVLDGSLVVVGSLDLRLTPSDPANSAFGHTVVSTQKKVIFVAAEYLDATVRGKWHSKVFVHELSHYSGISGHPLPGPFPGGWYDEKLIIWTGVSPQTNEFEPWFSVVANPPMRERFEGLQWGTQAQRRHPRPFITGLDGIPGDVMAITDAAIALQTPW